VTKLDAIRAIVQADRLGTHWVGCWKDHPLCREAYLLRLVDELAAAMAQIRDSETTVSSWRYGVCRAALARLDEEEA